MAFTLIANTGAGSVSGAGSTGTTPPVTSTDAALIIICCADFGASSAGDIVNDSKGNTGWAALTNAVTGSSNATMFYKTNPANGTLHTFTVGGAYNGFTVLIFTAGGAVTLDKQNGTGAGAASSMTGASVTPAEDNELIVSCIGCRPSTSPSSRSIAGAWTTVNHKDFAAGLSMSVDDGYLLQVTAAAIAPTWNSTVAWQDAATLTASFKEGGGAPAAGGRLLGGALLSTGRGLVSS